MGPLFKCGWVCFYNLSTVLCGLKSHEDMEPIHLCVRVHGLQGILYGPENPAALPWCSSAVRELLGCIHNMATCYWVSCRRKISEVKIDFWAAGLIDYTNQDKNQCLYVLWISLYHCVQVHFKTKRNPVSEVRHLDGANFINPKVLELQNFHVYFIFYNTNF